MTSSEQQSREIKDTGTNVLQMAHQINDVSRACRRVGAGARGSRWEPPSAASVP
jgi:hypothetical protein